MLLTMTTAMKKIVYYLLVYSFLYSQRQNKNIFKKN